MVLIQMLRLKILLCSIWLWVIKSIYKYTPWECFIPPTSGGGKKKKKNHTSALITLYYFSFTPKNLNIWVKNLYFAKANNCLQMQGSRKQVMSWQMQQKEGGKDFLMCKRGLTDLTEAFGPLLRNAQPSTETSVLHWFSIPYFTSTNSSCSSSFQLLLLQNFQA